MFACPVSLLLCGVAHRRRPLIVLECWPCHGWLHDCVPQSFCLLGKVELPFVFWAKWNFHSKDEECVFSSFPQCHKKCAEHVYEVENSVVTFNLPMFWLRYPARGVSALLVERLPTCLHAYTITNFVLDPTGSTVKINSCCALIQQQSRWLAAIMGWSPTRCNANLADMAHRNPLQRSIQDVNFEKNHRSPGFRSWRMLTFELLKGHRVISPKHSVSKIGDWTNRHHFCNISLYETSSGQEARLVYNRFSEHHQLWNLDTFLWCFFAYMNTTFVGEVNAPSCTFCKCETTDSLHSVALDQRWSMWQTEIEAPSFSSGTISTDF